MKINVFDNKDILGAEAAKAGIEAIKLALSEKKFISIIVATGASQFEMLDNLISYKDIDWSRITIFHLDEYIGLPEIHPASFRLYLQKRLIDRLPCPPRAFIGVNGSAENTQSEIERLSSLIAQQDIDVCFAGIGENCHLAFNDPPADFNVTSPYIIVNLDKDCRKQQLGEKWFATIDDVPERAISMSISQIIKSKVIILSIPDMRKADAVKAAIEGEISPMAPASILQNHPNCLFFLDANSAKKLTSIK